MTKIASHHYRADIDGLRAVAILLVVLFHSGASFLPGGFIGVDLFFVISGFLIGGIISKEIAQGTFSFYQFYLRRIRRIAPALFFMMTTLLLVSYFLLSPLEYSQLAKYSVGVFLSIPNIILLKGTNYFSASADLNPLLMTWSLGIEEQFYIVLPFILLLAAKFKRSMFGVVAFLSLASLAACIFLTTTNSTQAFYLLPTRAWEMGAGVLLALWKPQPITGRSANLFMLAGLIIALLCALTLTKAATFPGYLALFPVVAGCLLIVARGSLSQIILENAVMRFIGKVSYSWYLWHWPMLAIARICSDQPLNFMQGLSISALALALSWFSWRFVEQPFRKPMANTRVVIPAYCVMSAVAVVCMTGLWASGGLKYRVSPLVNTSESFKIAAETNPCLLTYGDNLPSNDPQCQPASPRPGIALIGDSHASALRSVVETYASLQQKPLYQLTKASCPFFTDGVTRAVYGYPAHARQCLAFNEQVLQLVKSDRIEEVIITAYWAAGIEDIKGAGFINPRHPERDNLTALKEGMDGVVAELRAAGKKVTIIDDAPLLKIDSLRYSINRNMPLRHELSDLLNQTETAQTLSERTQLYSIPSEKISGVLQGYRQSNVKVVSLTSNLCNQSGCLITDQGLPLYYDNNHLSPHGVNIALGKNW